MHLDTSEFRGVVRAAFDGRELVSVRRLRGGTKKGVYRLALDDSATCIAYVWNADEDYWPGSTDETWDELFGHATGLSLFVAAHSELAELGIRVPRMIFLDGSGARVEGEVAVLEDVRGGTLERLSEREPQRAGPVLARLGDAMQVMHQHQSARYGRPGHGRAAGTGPVEHIVLSRALDDLAASAARVDRLAAVAKRLPRR